MNKNDLFAQCRKFVFNYKISVIDDFDGNTELLLANVLYFKGNWFVEFNENETTIKCFYTKPSFCTEVNMMYLQNQLRYGYITDIKGHAVELLYEVYNLHNTYIFVMGMIEMNNSKYSIVIFN